MLGIITEICPADATYNWPKGMSIYLERLVDITNAHMSKEYGFMAFYAEAVGSNDSMYFYAAKFEYVSETCSHFVRNRHDR